VTEAGLRNGESAATRAAAFASLLDGVLARSYRLAAVVLQSEIDAQDATHDAALRAWRRFDSLRDPARFDAWFGRILINVCRDELASRARRIVEISMGGPEPAGRFEDTGAWSAERDALRRSINVLSPDHRIVIALRYFEDLTVEQIAERTGSRQGTVKSRLHYAVAELRAAYDAAVRDPKEAYQ
jgi:RNA polymerase sigma-70 factor, ECF subfamily